jgi:3-deoxy-7-phosphoheptulonate synthase
MKNRNLVNVGSVVFGGNEIILIGGPCAVENQDQIDTTAAALSKKGIKILRGGTFKPRTLSSSFQGLGENGLEMLKRAGKNHNLLTITEVMSENQLNIAAKYIDIIQVGARSMQNYPLLKAIGALKIPVVLKRGFAATIDEWLGAAEYIRSGGNSDIILCERGIRTFDNSNRFTLDIGAIGVVKKNSPFPIIIDPSHAAGKSEFVAALGRAALAAGADGLMVEVHPDPSKALSDGEQSLSIPQYNEFIDSLVALAQIMGRELNLK